jgi:hypothetical protein
MALTIDLWPAQEALLLASGWTVNSVRRYDPTVISGTTPTGRTFTFTAQNGVGEINVAGRTRTSNRSNWEAATDTYALLLACHLALPANQR